MLQELAVALREGSLRRHGATSTPSIVVQEVLCGATPRQLCNSCRLLSFVGRLRQAFNELELDTLHNPSCYENRGDRI